MGCPDGNPVTTTANFFLRQSSLKKAFASSSDAHGLPETAYLDPRSLMMLSRIRMAQA